MPMHDWTKVKSGTYHNFHYRWVAAIMDRLNAGLLPPGFFAMAEQRVAGPEPDVIALTADRNDTAPAGGGVVTAAPRASVIERATAIRYARKTNRIAIHHDLGTVVAVVEIVSPGNKGSRAALRSFVRKAARMIRHGIHLLIIDPFPPSKRDPRGIHPAIWSELTPTEYVPPPGKPMTLAAYHAIEEPAAYIEPIGVGDSLPDMPLFIWGEAYVNVPLEETYQTTWNVLPKEIRVLLEPETR